MSKSTAILKAGLDTEIAKAAQVELAPYTWGIVIQSETCWVHLGRGSIEYHHIVPRAYGGENGPQVALCGNCHTGIHNLSFKSLLFDGQLAGHEKILSLTKEFASDWIPSSALKSKEQNRILVRAWGLANVIFKSRKLVNTADEEGNKKIQFHTTFDGEENRMLKVLKTSYGVNQDQLIKLALRELYSRRIGAL